MIKGYKVFNSDWTCRDFKYEVGKTYKHHGKIAICESGFHFCLTLADCLNYYNDDMTCPLRYAEVEALGNVKSLEKEESSFSYDTMHCTDKIRIVREIPHTEVSELVNFGKNNSYGSHHNIGDHNDGHFNLGSFNRGSYNIGNFNIGASNLGSHNYGTKNYGSCNNGSYNNGDYNNGSYNIGNYNIGDYNHTDNAIGFFNTKPTYHISLFNKPVDMPLNKIKDIINNNLVCCTSNIIYGDISIVNCHWIKAEDAEINSVLIQKAADLLRGITSAKVTTLTERKQRPLIYQLNATYWNQFKELPNYDEDVFKEITGIKTIEEKSNSFVEFHYE